MIGKCSLHVIPPGHGQHQLLGHYSSFSLRTVGPSSLLHARAGLLKLDFAKPMILPETHRQRAGRHPMLALTPSKVFQRNPSKSASLWTRQALSHAEMHHAAWHMREPVALCRQCLAFSTDQMQARDWRITFGCSDAFFWSNLCCRGALVAADGLQRRMFPLIAKLRSETCRVDFKHNSSLK